MSAGKTKNNTRTEVVIEACARVRPDRKDYVGLVEPCQDDVLPGQLLVARSLGAVSNGSYGQNLKPFSSSGDAFSVLSVRSDF